MSHPLVKNLRDTKVGTRIDRTTKWGNPFFIGKDGDRKEVIRKHKKWFPKQKRLVAALPELKGEILLCWCAPLACHGDFLAEQANK